MTEPVRDQWAEGLLERRFGGDSGQREKYLGDLIPTTHLRRLVERNESKGMSVVAYFWAVKQEG